ncbi:GFA family protein [Marinobacter bohaiensis]|uniref:GFA family protein n=1 Tax=Marinobacter bohaiensis TaxID=2201898 RepID=UPI00195513DE|nr:GFA family protein [Marinobacter bohaiensis]
MEHLLPLEGECRCGKVGIRVDAPPILTMACHCTGCQKMSASAYSLTAAIPRDAFSVTRGDPVIGGLRGPDARHFFCPDCMTWMFTRLDAALPFVNVRPTLLDDCSWFVPFIETYTSEKLPWTSTPATHSFEAFPPPESFESLAGEYAQSIRRY